MRAMKVLAAACLGLASGAAAAAAGVRGHSWRRAGAGALAAAGLAAREGVTPKDIAMCLGAAAKFIPTPMGPKAAVDAAVDYCTEEMEPEDRSRVCPHFKDAVVASLENQPQDEPLSAETFCELAEARMLECRGAVRVPRIGTGPLMAFKLAESCESTVAQAMAPLQTVDAETVPDLWYSICLNQDCAHYLPSRTKWCNVDHAATHSAWVCRKARNYAKDGAAEKVAAANGGELNATVLCGLYADFVKDVGIDVEAYEHVMHADTIKRVPKPSQAINALVSSQLVNEAGGHDLLTEPAKPVPPQQASWHRSGAAGVRLPAALLSLPILAALRL